MKTIRVYDGSLECAHCSHCPVVDYMPEEGNVVIHDPDRPQNGSMKMTVAEFNALISNARPIG